MRKIRAEGPLDFREFMAMALYDPQAGYYARHAEQVGRDGDFFTSVSAGPLFGRLLAAHILRWHAESGSPKAWRVVELGAHDGTLARDILEEIRKTDSEAFAGLQYLILEPLDRLAATQRETLAEFAIQLEIAQDPRSVPPLPGYLIANEVLDALPFHLVESDGSEWQEMGVTVDDHGRLGWMTLGPAGDLTRLLPQRPAGYRTELRSDFESFLAPLVDAIRPGRMLWVDYGFERDDYYADSRTNGTLRTFHRHQADEDPLDSPGTRDITAHVDFTAVQEAVTSLGGSTLRFENQARFLTAAARPWLLSLEGRTDPAAMKLLRNFQTLTHPGQMGSRFHFLETGFQA